MLKSNSFTNLGRALLPSNPPTRRPLLPYVAVVIVTITLFILAFADIDTVLSVLRSFESHKNKLLYQSSKSIFGSLGHLKRRSHEQGRRIKGPYSNGNLFKKEAAGVYVKAVVVDFYLSVAEDKSTESQNKYEIQEQSCPQINIPPCKQLGLQQLLSKKVPKQTMKLREATLPPFDIPEELKIFMSKPVINPHNTGYIHNLEFLCPSKSPDIIMMIASRPEHVYRRREIREDKLDMLNLSKMFRIKPLFFMGKADPSLNNSDLADHLISLESEAYRDIVQADFIDVLHNRTTKTVSMLNWMLRYCSSARYVIFTTDSVTLNNQVVSSLRKIGRSRDNFILGQILSDIKISSNPKDEYFLTEDQKRKFPEEFLPTFAESGLWGLPVNTARLLYEASLRVPRYPIESVYITGLCALEVKVPLVEDIHFRFDPRVLDESEEVI